MRAHELTELTREEIEIRLADSLDALSNLRFQHAMHQLDNPLLVKGVRRDIARYRTVLHEFELGIRKVKQKENQ